MPRLISCLTALASAIPFLAPQIASINMALAQKSTALTYAIVLHGGAGGDPAKWTDEYRARRRAGLQAALDHGLTLLRAGESALDVVEQVVKQLEDHPDFNAGRGCVLNEMGEHELDAAIMDGSNRKCGAVAGVKSVKNPISAARRVMTDTSHVLLMGPGADTFAKSKGLEQAGADYFRTQAQLDAWQRWKNKPPSISALVPDYRFREPAPEYLGTVGCVALDTRGNLSAATSTGGLMGKRWGRVGDTPLIGAGTYADNDTCGVSCTGIGEEFIRHSVAADLAARMRYGSKTLARAASEIVSTVLPKESGGLIAVDGTGNIVMEFNTHGMSRAAGNSAGRREASLARDEQ